MRWRFQRGKCSIISSLESRRASSRDTIVTLGATKGCTRNRGVVWFTIAIIVWSYTFSMPYLSLSTATVWLNPHLEQWLLQCSTVVGLGAHCTQFASLAWGFAVLARLAYLLFFLGLAFACGEVEFKVLLPRCKYIHWSPLRHASFFPNIQIGILATSIDPIWTWSSVLFS